MAALETEMEMASRHIAQSERHIREQRLQITRMRKAGVATDVAEDLLDEMVHFLADHRQHMDRLLAKDRT